MGDDQMPHAFLSDDWYDAFDSIRGQAPAPATSMADVTINVVVTGGPDGERELHMAGGQFERGLAEGAPTKLTVPYDVARSLFIKGDSQAAMQAFMSGQIKVEGDMSRLMAMQGGNMAPSPEQTAFQQKLHEITT
jgi:hypothetical protein